MALSLLTCATAEGADPHALKLATWNLEWLMATDEFDHLAPDCVPQLARAEGRAIPCNIVEPNNSSKRRSPADFDRLRAYARQLDADVIALQEVDSRRKLNGDPFVLLQDALDCFLHVLGVAPIGNEDIDCHFWSVL